MKENLDLTEILKFTPTGTKLYSVIHGDVNFIRVDTNKTNPIESNVHCFTSDGKYGSLYKNAECILFPDKNQRDWSLFESTYPDKSLVWAWDDYYRYGRELLFFDAKNNCTFCESTGKRNGSCYDNYILYNGKEPDWAEEARQSLED